mmetsp:Transcript_24969/g.85576  ORF Transcript_24969/g.85576 Transcript_24969/m.85576 type:complete len:208 (-) Transcript_24969:152-775(-)
MRPLRSPKRGCLIFRVRDKERLDLGRACAHVDEEFLGEGDPEEAVEIDVALPRHRGGGLPRQRAVQGARLLELGEAVRAVRLRRQVEGVVERRQGGAGEFAAREPRADVGARDVGRVEAGDGADAEPERLEPRPPRPRGRAPERIVVEHDQSLVAEELDVALKAVGDVAGEGERRQRVLRPHRRGAAVPDHQHLARARPFENAERQM